MVLSTDTNRQMGWDTYGRGMDMTTSPRWRYSCSSSYSTFTSHVPAFSDGQQFTEEEEEEEEEKEKEEEEKEEEEEKCIMCFLKSG